MRTVDQVKYDIGQKVYVYDEGKIIECSIQRIFIDECGVVYGTDRKKTTLEVSSSMEARVEYVKYIQERLFAKKSEALAYAIKFKNMMLQDKIRELGIDELKKELEEELKREEKE